MVTMACQMPILRYEMTDGEDGMSCHREGLAAQPRDVLSFEDDMSSPREGV